MAPHVMSTLLVVGAFWILALPASAQDIDAKAKACNACHGEAGIPSDPNLIPIIWGQNRTYLLKQLRDYRNGERNSPIMTPIAKALAEADLRPIADFFSIKHWPSLAAPVTTTAPPVAIAQCQPCHQSNFEGTPAGPRLAGLSYEYLVAEMRRYAGGQRINTGDMPKFMKALTDTERDTLARYVSQLR